MVKEQPKALQFADYLEDRANELQTWIDENDYVEFGYRPDGLKREQSDFRQISSELRRLHQPETEGWRYADELEQERKRLNLQNQELLEVLKAVTAHIDRICTHTEDYVVIVAAEKSHK